MRVKILRYHDKEADNKSIDEVVAKNEQAITRLYDMYRDEFIGFFVREYDINNTDAIELYQESFLAMHQNITSGKLEKITYTLKTYLFKIGKNKIYNRFRDAKPAMELSSYMLGMESEEEQLVQNIVYEVVSAMENPCGQLLSLFYWEQQSMKEIADVMNYKNERVAITRKSNCMKRLKERLFTRLREEDLM